MDMGNSPLYKRQRGASFSWGGHFNRIRGQIETVHTVSVIPDPFVDGNVLIRIKQGHPSMMPFVHQCVHTLGMEFLLTVDVLFGFGVSGWWTPGKDVLIVPQGNVYETLPSLEDRFGSRQSIGIYQDNQSSQRKGVVVKGKPFAVIVWGHND